MAIKATVTRKDRSTGKVTKTTETMKPITEKEFFGGSSKIAKKSPAKAALSGATKGVASTINKASGRVKETITSTAKPRGELNRGQGVKSLRTSKLKKR